MSKVLQLRRGTTAETAVFTGHVGEVTVDTTTDSLVVHDNLTVGGHRQASEAYVQAAIANIDVSNLNVNLGNLQINNNTISSINTNANIDLEPNGTGNVNILGNLHISSAYLELGNSDEFVIRYAAAGIEGNPYNRINLSTSLAGNSNIAVSISSTTNRYMFFNPESGNIGINTRTPTKNF